MKKYPLKSPVYGPVRQIPRGGPLNTMGNSGRSAKYHGPQITFQLREKIGEPRFPPVGPFLAETKKRTGLRLSASSVFFLQFVERREVSTTKTFYYGKEDHPITNQGGFYAKCRS